MPGPATTFADGFSAFCRQTLRTVTVRHDVTVQRALIKILQLEDNKRKAADLPDELVPEEYCLQARMQPCVSGTCVTWRTAGSAPV